MLSVLVFFLSTQDVFDSNHSAQAEITPTKTIDHEEGQAYILSSTQTNYLPIRNLNVDEPTIDAKAGIVYDLRSGRILFEHNSKKKLPIASITKLMSAVIIIENMDLDAVYKIADEDLNTDGLGTNLYKDEHIKGEDLFIIMLVNSDNDAASVFARNAKEQGFDFVGAMNAKAFEIEMSNTKFSDPAGLDDQDTYSTALDLVRLMQYANKYPLIWDTLTTKTGIVTSIDGKLIHSLNNTNKLLGVLGGIRFGKTGRTDGALETLALIVDVVDSEYEDDGIVSVILGSNNRFGESEKLITWAREAHTWKVNEE